MSKPGSPFWPFPPRSALFAVIGLLIVLLAILAALRATVNWPSETSETGVLIGIMVLSLLPLLLALLDVLIAQGAIIEYAGVKVNFARSKETAPIGITVAPNIGVPGVPVSDSSSAQILETLREATRTAVAVIDLERGQAWWETRLFVLLAGANRLRKPDKIVFVGTDATVERRFEGWAHPDDLLPLLAATDPRFEWCLYATRAAAWQWQLVEPLERPVTPAGVAAANPPVPPWMTGTLAKAYQWMAFDAGLPNDLFAEQLLQSELGKRIETQEPPRSITLTRLEDLFRPVLNKEAVDLTWPAEKQLEAFLSSNAPYIAVTTDGRYSALVSRETLLNEAMKSLVRGSGKNDDK